MVLVSLPDYFEQMISKLHLSHTHMHQPVSACPIPVVGHPQIQRTSSRGSGDQASLQLNSLKIAKIFYFKSLFFLIVRRCHLFIDEIAYSLFHGGEAER